MGKIRIPEVASNIKDLEIAIWEDASDAQMRNLILNLVDRLNNNQINRLIKDIKKKLV